VIRLLPGRIPFNIENLGFLKTLPVYKTWLQQPQGMIILTGPTGSGKTVRFTQSANRGKEHVNVVTVEDRWSTFCPPLQNPGA